MRILIVEDSDTVALLLKAIFSAESDMEVIGQARNGRDAVDMVAKLKPDVITMDIHMPDMDGLEATRRIMQSNPVPIVVISSSVNDEEQKITFRAIEAGAMTVIAKPRGTTHPEFEAMRAELVGTVRAMAEVKVVRRREKPASVLPLPLPVSNVIVKPEHKASYKLVAIACSTGGPQALKSILSGLPADFPVPIVIVQHITVGFIAGMVEWLQGMTAMKIGIARDKEVLQPGNVYFGPDDYHLTVVRNNGQLLAALNQQPVMNGFRPSATPLLESVAQACGAEAVGCILTGMGADGALGLLKLHKAKSYTFVQDEGSSVVFGMPAAALALGATKSIVKLNEISAHLVDLVSND